MHHLCSELCQLHAMCNYSLARVWSSCTLDVSVGEVAWSVWHPPPEAEGPTAAERAARTAQARKHICSWLLVDPNMAAAFAEYDRSATGAGVLSRVIYHDAPNPHDVIGVIHGSSLQCRALYGC